MTRTCINFCAATDKSPGEILEALYEGEICHTLAVRDFLVVSGLDNNQDGRNLFDSMYDDYIESRNG